MEQQCQLNKKKCTPCNQLQDPLDENQANLLLKELGNGWQIINQHHLEKSFKFKDFAEALNYVNQLGAIAENEGHHPDIFLAYGKVIVEIWTHKINGLSEEDFILASKFNELKLNS
jgi:4a-hydroxytetrahydrobiopterin dehydratase